MWNTCKDVKAMLKMIQIRNVPEELHRTLKSRAALAGMSLSDYLHAELRRVVERPTRAELLARLRSRERVELKRSAAETVSSERLSR